MIVYKKDLNNESVTIFYYHVLPYVIRYYLLLIELLIYVKYQLFFKTFASQYSLVVSEELMT